MMRKESDRYVTEMEPIKEQVLRNCSISDSRFAGNLSICGLALRLRDLYKWEKALEPWIEEEPAVMLDWIGRKEEEWEALSDCDFGDITIHATPYTPFDTEKINAVLESFGFFYGAGFVHGLKPTFFLAALEETKEVEGQKIYILGRELARDLFTLPAMTQQEEILIRSESAGHFLWNQIFFVKKSGKGALRFGLHAYGLSEDPISLRSNLTRISAAELETYIYHEIGEIRENAFDRDVWREMLSVFPHSPVEFLVRSVKDVLADTGESGTLRHIIKARKAASLGFFVAFLDGLKKELFSKLPPAFTAFASSGDWSLIEEAVSFDYQRAKGYAETITDIFRKGKETGGDLEAAKKEIERRVLESLIRKEVPV